MHFRNMSTTIFINVKNEQSKLATIIYSIVVVAKVLIYFITIIFAYFIAF